MVLTLDGNSEHVAHAWKKWVFPKRHKIRFVTTLNLIKCLKHIKKQRLRLTCAPISDLPSNISTMLGTFFWVSLLDSFGTKGSKAFKSEVMYGMWKKSCLILIVYSPKNRTTSKIYCLYKKSWTNLCSDLLLYKIGQDFLDRQYN